MLNFSNTPKKILEIYFGSRKEWPFSAGFGQTFDFMVHFLCECLHEGYFPIIDDSTWWYGRWEDFFEPFWDEEEKQRILKIEGLPIERRDVNIPTLAGCAEIRSRPYIKENYDKIAHSIFRLNNRMINEINKLDFPEFNLAIHIRCGYEMRGVQPCRQSWIHNLEGYINHILPIIKTNDLSCKSVYLLTDNSEAVSVLKSYLGNEIVSMCPPGSTGSVDDRSPQNLERLIKEMDIAVKARYFIGAKFSNIPNIIKTLRDHQNCFLF